MYIFVLTTQGTAGSGVHTQNETLVGGTRSFLFPCAEGALCVFAMLGLL